MSTGRKVSKKSIFPTSFDLSTVFKRILWILNVNFKRKSYFFHNWKFSIVQNAVGEVGN